ncbi:MAG: protein kinase, partial [candidate division NC10 bacterium]
PTLADKIAQGPIPVEDALKIALQIAEGLEAAHEKGIIHRDLKPANIKITPEGQVKILDFGLAKAFEEEISPADLSQSPTLTQGMTRAGVILGTAAYMSPEQARGRELDKRADIWAFGCVLYEMLSGKMAFPGDDITDILAAIIRAEPVWSSLPDGSNPRLRELLEGCLEKEGRNRWHDIADVRIDLEKIQEDPHGSSVAPQGGVHRLAGSHLTWALAALLLGAALTAIAAWSLPPKPAMEPPTVRFSFGINTNHGLMTGWAVRRVAISPDGSTIAYLADSEETGADRFRQLYLREMDESEGTPIPGTEGAADPFFSPDGEWVGFLASGELQRVSVQGGAPLKIYKAAQMFGASWAPDDSIIFGGGMGSGLMRVPIAGGTPEPLTAPDPQKGELLHGNPEVLPDGETVLFTIGTGTGSRIALLSLDSGTWKELLPSGASPHYLPAGYLLFSEESNLRLVRLDLERKEVVGPVFPVLENVEFENFAGLAEALFAISQSGDLVFIPGGLGVGETRPVWVDSSGRETIIDADPAFYIGPVISPDERVRVAVIKINDLGIGEVWVMNADGSQAFPVSADGADYNPAWTPDGNTLTFTSNGDMFERLVDREDPRSLFLTRENYQLPRSWSPDGQYLAFVESSANGYHIWVMPRDGDPTPLLDLSFNSGSPRFSPQGGWIAYVSEESGRREVYLRQYPGSVRGERISRGGGQGPRWSADGRQLFYRTQDRMLAVDITTEPNLRIGEPVELWERPYYSLELSANANYDVAPDGRFLMLGLPESDASQLVMIGVVVNWFSEVQQRMEANN